MDWRGDRLYLQWDVQNEQHYYFEIRVARKMQVSSTESVSVEFDMET